MKNLKVKKVSEDNYGIWDIFHNNGTKIGQIVAIGSRNNMQFETCDTDIRLTGDQLQQISLMVDDAEIGALEDTP